jgi:hypothetical protein
MQTRCTNASPTPRRCVSGTIRSTRSGSRRSAPCAGSLHPVLLPVLGRGHAKTDQCRGMVNYHDGHIRSKRVAIGYIIDPARHRKGIATEAVSAMLDFCFGDESRVSGAVTPAPASIPCRGCRLDATPMLRQPGGDAFLEPSGPHETEWVPGSLHRGPADLTELANTPTSRLIIWVGNLFARMLSFAKFSALLRWDRAWRWSLPVLLRGRCREAERYLRSPWHSGSSTRSVASG